ncbi:MAG: hypothetical protein ACERKN_18590 [Velocimicrobium sp.]
MKNIVVFTMETRGDVQPYIYLTQALIKEGHKVTIVFDIIKNSSNDIYESCKNKDLVIVSHSDFAERLYKLEVSVTPIKASELSEEKLINAINELKTNYSKIYNCVVDLSKKMQEENGLLNAVRLIKSATDLI